MWKQSCPFFFSSGDLEFFWEEQIQNFQWLPQTFSSNKNFGVANLKELWLAYPFTVFVKAMSWIGLSWWWIEKILWVGAIALALYVSYRLATYLVYRASFGILASLIYTTNTYALLLFGGGQLGVALAYSLSPLVLLKFIQYMDTQINFSGEINDQRSTIKDPIINGLWFALLVCFDVRLAYLVMGAIVLYLVSRIWYLVLHRRFLIQDTICKILYTIIVPLLITFLVHLFWILPMILAGGGTSLGGEEYTNAGMLKFLSVADFSHTVSFLHPNWPENLFGKVYFLQPEFLVLPILAFASLLFVKMLRITGYGLEKNNSSLVTHNQQTILFFAFLSLLGAFLAKGVNPPFGGVYEWFFSYVPGFVMFRDPTKFYLYVALGYSMLIPASIWYLVSGISYKKKQPDFIQNTIYKILYTIFILFWCFTIRPLFLGQLSGNFRPVCPDSEFVRLKNVLVDDKEPSRTLWIPQTDTFVFSSDVHPALSGSVLFKNASLSAVMDLTARPAFQETIRDAGVKYVVIPMDAERSIFLSDYTWDPKQREDLVTSLSAANLIPNPEFQKMAVFENQDFVFRQEKPPYIEKQEMWSRTGLVISVIALGLLLGIIAWDTKQ